MALELVLTQSAEHDLLGLWVYIAERDIDAADRTLDSIHEAAGLLCEQPLMGISRPDLAEGVRSLAVGRWLLIYLVDDDRVVVTRVFDGRRDPSRLILDRS